MASEVKLSRHRNVALVAHALVSACVLLPTQCVAQTLASFPIETELWVGGDDGLTGRFAHALKSTIGRSPGFAISKNRATDALVLTIPNSVHWQRVEGRINFQYVVVFTNHSSKYLGVSTGNCLEEDMVPCAEKVLSDAELVWRSEPDARPR